MALEQMKCEPCSIGTTPLGHAQAEKLLSETPLWTLQENALEREFHFKDFRQAMAFVNRVADIAEEQGHHPDIYISYSTVRLTLSTHKIHGLSMNDFILAAKIGREEGG